MSNIASGTAADLLNAGGPHPGESAGGGHSEQVGLRRSWLGQVLLNAFGRIGARLGAIWILIVAFCAVFAPVLANSFPLLVKMDGKWFSPMLHYLTAADITLLVCTLAGIALFCFKSLSIRTRWVSFIGVVVLTLLVSLLFVRPPFVRSYEEYRELRQAGRLQYVLNAPVPYSPTDHLSDQFDPERPQPWGPSKSHPLGNETHGEDILSVMIHACRIAMSIGAISTGIALVIGITIGGLMGYFAGVVDLLGMRLVEVFGAIPTIYLLLAFCAAFERDIYMVMAIIGLTGWTTDARFVRAEFLKLRNQDFVHGAIAAGLPLRSILFRHLLPNALAPLLVSASFGVASAILSEAVLSFLGLGLPVDAASWGRLLNEAVGEGGGFYWWLATFPGFAIFLTVFAYNLVGESFRDALDPKLSPQ